MNLGDLRPVEGSRKKIRRVGRGRGSGWGKTSTRGHNGQGQRSGEATRFGFEGGQTPLFRRLPKIHNFYDIPRRQWVSLNIGHLNHLKANTEVNPESLVELKVLRAVTKSLRILGEGELKVALHVKAHHFSQGAMDKIEQAGGKWEVIQPAPRKRGRIPLSPPKGKGAKGAGKPAAAAAPKAEKAEKPAEKPEKGENKDAE